jgi:phosphatidylglycerol:prolipoprotein diacylglycerol transferase
MTPDRSEIITYGATLTGGKFSETNYATGGEISRLLIDAGGFIKYDAKWIGLGAGLHLGNLVYSKGDVFRQGLTISDMDHAYFKTPIFPSGYLRVGPVRSFYADIHIADQFPVSSPGLGFIAGVGTGLGFTNGTSLRIGSSIIDEGTIYVSAYIPIQNKFIIEPLYLWTNRSSVYPSYPYSLPENQFSLGLSYRFGNK